MRPSNRKLLFILLCLPVLWLTGDQVHGVSSPWVQVEGVGFSSTGDTAAARDRALEDAMVRAVEHSLGVDVNAQTVLYKSLLLNDSLVTSSRGVVREYTVLDEWLDDFGMYRIRINARVDAGVMQSAFKSASGNRHVLLVTETSELADHGTFQQLSLAKLLNLFSEAGFTLKLKRLAPGAQNIFKADEAREMARREQCDLVLFLSASSSKPACAAENYCAVQLRGQARFWNGGSGELIASARVEKARGFGNTPELALNAGYRTVGQLLGDRLIDQLFNRSDRRIRIEIMHLPDRESYLELARILGAMRWVAGVEEDEFGYHQRKSVLHLTFSANPEYLFNMLETINGYKVLGRTTGKVVLTYAANGQ